MNYATSMVKLWAFPRNAKQENYTLSECPEEIMMNVETMQIRLNYSLYQLHINVHTHTPGHVLYEEAVMIA